MGSLNKFGMIESGLHFEAATGSFLTNIPSPPSNLLLILENRGSSRDKLTYSFVYDNYSGVNSHYIYAAPTGNFTGSAPPSGNFIIANLPVFITRGTYIFTGSGQYDLRVYSQSYAGTFSTGFASGSIVVLKGNPISSLQIGNLTVSNSTGDSNTVILGGPKSTGTFSGIEPYFSWATLNTQDTLFSDLFSYRVTIRPPTVGYTPSSTIWYSENNIQKSPWQFQFSGHFASGLHRDFDVVVEAMHPSGLTSAGNHILGGETWANPLGFDWMRARNLAPSGFFLTSGNTIQGLYKTEQWIDGNGAIQIIIQSGLLSKEKVIGGYIFSSTGIFSGQNISGNIPSRFPIKTGYFDYKGENRILIADSRYTEIKTGYVAVALFDSFDLAQSGYYNIITGSPLWISPICPIESSGSFSKLDINDRLTIKNIDNFGDKFSIRVRRVNQGSAVFVEMFAVNAPGSGIRYNSYSV
jgi:hypothetical protein